MREKTGNGHSVDLEQFMEDIRAVVHDGQELLKAGASSAKAKAVAGAQGTDRLVRSHPYQTVAILFGVGLLAGVILSGMLGGETEPEEE